MQLSRSDISSKYKLPEKTLAALEELEDSLLMSPELQTVIRGRVFYTITPELDLFLKVGQAHYTMLREKLLPCHRALLFHMIVEPDFNVACASLRDRAIVFHKVPDRALAFYWRNFLSHVQPECLPYITGKVPEPTPADTVLLHVLGLTEAMADPYKVMDKFSWLSTPETRVLTDAFLAAQADVATIRKYLSEAYRFDVTEDAIREYRRYFFDLTVSGTGGAITHAQVCTIPSYRSTVCNALKNSSVGDVVNELKLSALIDKKISIESSLRQSRAYMTTNPSRETGRSLQHAAFKAGQDVYYIMNTIDRTAAEAESGQGDAMMELLKLKHDPEINTQQLSVQELPKEARDAFVSGPIKTSNK